MKNSRLQKQTLPQGEQRIRTYSEIVEYLDSRWKVPTTGNRATMQKQLDVELSNVSQSIRSIVITGTNGKSLTAHFTARLLQEEGLKVGVFYAPHILTYNERFSINEEFVNNKQFVDVANDVINISETVNTPFHTSELLFFIACEYFKNQGVHVMIIETQHLASTDPVHLCHPKVVGITRVIDEENKDSMEAVLNETLSVLKTGTHVVSADQSKQSLQMMQKITKDRGGVWAMPLRKVASLPYPFEQLHGRCAALAERIASIYTNETITTENQAAEAESFLVKKKGQRGRPTLEVKRHNELHPPKTINEFWAKTVNHLPARFQLLDKEKPTILLDNASNLDAIENLLLGIRLLHYQKPFKGLSIILGCNDIAIDSTKLLKMLRYFFKKTSGQIVVCPVAQPLGRTPTVPWNAEKIANDLKSMKIKAVAANNFEEAFTMAKEMVDERYGLVVVTGSTSIITEYWKLKGIKRI